MRRRAVLIGATVVVVLALAGVGAIAFSRQGEDSAEAAVLDHVAERADTGTSKTLAQQKWGNGQLVLVGYERNGVRRLGLAFSSKGFGGWRVGSYTEESVEPDDVVVGSLLVASSEGGEGQPAWSAAVGELIDSRIDRVEVKWASGESGFGPRTGDAYLVVEEGTTIALEARYLSKDGAEIAKVPVEKD